MTEPTTNLPDAQTGSSDDDEISLLDLLIVLAKHKKLVVGLPFMVAVLAAGFSLLMPNIFTGVTKILLPQQSESTAAAILGQFGGLAGVAGGAAGIKNPNDLYVGMLKSRTVADNIIQRFGLMQIYQAKYPSQTRQVLAGVTNITAGKEGIITIEVDDKDPKRAAELANAYVDELLNLTKVLAVTEASQRRLFFERQFEQARDNLTKAEAAARQALEKGGSCKSRDRAELSWKRPPACADRSRSRKCRLAPCALCHRPQSGPPTCPEGTGGAEARTREGRRCFRQQSRGPAREQWPRHRQHAPVAQREVLRNDLRATRQAVRTRQDRRSQGFRCCPGDGQGHRAGF